MVRYQCWWFAATKSRPRESAPVAAGIGRSGQTSTPRPVTSASLPWSSSSRERMRSTPGVRASISPRRAESCSIVARWSLS